MSCHCGAAAISERGLCEEHFCAWLESTVHQTIAAYHMIEPSDRVLVAASGGKDSLTLLHILSQRYAVTAYCIDEGIAGYREKTIEDLKRFCAARGITLRIESFQEAKGTTLDALDPQHPCTTCGVWRRELMAKAARDADVIATGHNMDDEAQAILMNIFRNHPMRPRPVLPGGQVFVRRVKPLYFIPEADVRRYAYIHGFVSAFVECKNAARSHRRAIQHFLEKREAERAGSKEQLVREYLTSLAA